MELHSIGMRHKIIITLFLFFVSGPHLGQDVAHQDTAEWKPLQVPPLPQDQELGERKRLERHAPPQRQQGQACTAIAVGFIQEGKLIDLTSVHIAHPNIYMS